MGNTGPAAAARDTAEAAREAWALLHKCFHVHRERVQNLLEELGISFGDMRALLVLEADNPQPMRCLADSWACDASNATWMVDRLEQRGLVDRRVMPTDRRIKAVALTAAGLELKEELTRRLEEPAPELLVLPEHDLAELTRVLAKLYP